MTGVLHPVGPEPAQTYWWRRFLVVAVGVVLVLVVILASTMGSGEATVTANPPPPPGPVAPEPTPSTSPSTVSPTPAARTASPTPTPTKTAPAKTASTKAVPSKSPSATSSTKPQRKPARPSKTATPPPPPPAACAPNKLRTTLTGKRTLRPKQDNVFALSLINGSGTSCVVSVKPDNFELKIYSGTDRIWSSDDCRRAVRPLTRTLRSEEAVEWNLRWNGRRSRDDCKNRPEIPKAGTYIATAQFAGAKPVQLRVMLRG